VVPRVPDPEVVSQFNLMKETKRKLLIRQRLKERIEEKKKELSKLKHLYAKSELEFEEKSEVFKEKSALLRVLGSKMEGELNKTKERYRDVEFNRIIVQGVKKVLYYRLTEILFNENTRAIFKAVGGETKDDESLGNCIGYLALFISIVGSICGARMWINFTFRGPRSSIRLSDGTVAILHPR
jgi:predicted nuclease with TOPRIM domain